MPPEEQKTEVVVIHLEPGKPVQINGAIVTLDRVRAGRAKIEVRGGIEVHRLDSEEPESLKSK